MSKLSYLLIKVFMIAFEGVWPKVGFIKEIEHIPKILKHNCIACLGFNCYLKVVIEIKNQFAQL